jgi:hypothetical protein
VAARMRMERHGVARACLKKGKVVHPTTLPTFCLFFLSISLSVLPQRCYCYCKLRLSLVPTSPRQRCLHPIVGYAFVSSTVPCLQLAQSHRGTTALRRVSPHRSSVPRPTVVVTMARATPVISLSSVCVRSGEVQECSPRG